MNRRGWRSDLIVKDARTSVESSLLLLFTSICGVQVEIQPLLDFRSSDCSKMSMVRIRPFLGVLDFRVVLFLMLSPYPCLIGTIEVFSVQLLNWPFLFFPYMLSMR